MCINLHNIIIKLFTKWLSAVLSASIICYIWGPGLFQFKWKKKWFNIFLGGGD